MFQEFDFSIVFSWKIYPEILDFRFSILYLCSIENHHEVHRVPQSFSISPLVIQTTEGAEGSREHPLRRLCYALEILRYATLHSG